MSAFAALIDGKHATMGSELRTVLSVGAQRLWMSTLANTGAAVDTTIAEFLRIGQASSYLRVAASTPKPRMASSGPLLAGAVASRAREWRQFGVTACCSSTRGQLPGQEKSSFR